MNKWWQYIREGKEVKRASPAGIRRSLGILLTKGPQKEGSPYENEDEFLKDKKSRNDISAPPGAPGGLEEEVEPESFEKQPALYSHLWRDNKLKPKILRRLTKIVNDFLEGLNIAEEVIVEDIRLTGSLANYNWSKYSDIDLHIVVDFSKIDDNVELVKAFFDEVRMRWNDLHDIMIHGHEVEIYVENINETHRSSGLYSIMNDEWITEPDPTKTEFDYVTARKQADSIETQVNLIDKFAREKPRDALKSVERLKEKIRRMRKAGLDSPQMEYSAENIAFKILRREETLDKLNNMKYHAYDKILSIEE